MARSSRYIWYRVRSELTSEVSRYYLSYLWWILEPCLMIGVFYLVFGVVFERGGEGFVSFLVLGVTAWLWFAHTVAKATLSVRSQTGLMRQVYVPKYVFPLSAVLFGVFKHFFVLIVLMGLLFYINTPSTVWAFYLLIFLVQLIFILAISTVVAGLVPFIPDLAKIIPPMLYLTMFLSGVFYPQSMIPSEYVPYFRFNPMAGLIMEYRKVMLEYQLPDFDYLLKVALYSGLFLLFGLWVLKKFDRVYPRMTD
ncbi:MAG: ABC transporter permease [Gammaproteobacteria bacterium]|nr:ABC transporter permease [Gammaproteobacteria bacterium]